CYQLGGGTSNATPFAAGAVARLLSAARLSGFHTDVSLVNWAVRSSARLLPAVAGHDQGNGLLQIDRAWQLLRTVAADRRLTPDRIEVSAPVVNRYNQFLGGRRTGPGLYEREGWHAGTRTDRTVTLIRRTGRSTPILYGLRWRDNDGTFELR